MKKSILIMVPLLLFIYSCSDPSDDSKKSMADVSLVALGDSITMGVQDAGLKQAYQENAYPYLIAEQMGLIDEFEQPWLSEEGTGLPPFSTPLSYSPSTGDVTSDFGDIELPEKLLSLVPNFFLDRSYSNLGIGGARLLDVRNAKDSSTAEDTTNLLFNLVLRDRGSMLEQAVGLSPELVLLWIGANDVLHAVSNGTAEGITPAADFDIEYRPVMDGLINSGADIVMALLPQYIPFVMTLNEWKQDGEWYLPDETDITVLNTETALYLEESDVDHLLLYGFFEILASIERGGDLGISADNRLPGKYTLTGSEYAAVEAGIIAINEVISRIALDYNDNNNVRLVDVSGFWQEEPEGEYALYSGKYVLADQENTIFSLDSVHPNNLGQAMIANAFIDEINKLTAYSGNPVPKIEVSAFAGQYSGETVQTNTLYALRKVPENFR